MYKKTFVSLSFSATSLQAVLLNASKNQVVKFATTTIPDGLIANHRVTDSKKLAQVIKEFLNKNGFSEHSVGLVIPEFSTFAKTLTLPILENHELDEAIRWQSQEFLPIPIDQIVLDWKTISKTEKEAQVLAVAIPADVLTGYVEAVGIAGLYPLVVETPSLTLTRLGNTSVTRMILYGSSGEAVLIVAKGEKIVGSVVAASTDTNTIIQTAVSMKQRFSDLEITSLAVAGTEISQDVYTQLSQVLKLTVEWLTVPVKGIAPNQVQEYLIPISQQLKDASEPSDESTINLLPPKWVSEYDEKRTKNRLWGILLFTTFIIGSCLAISGIVFGMLSTQIASFQGNRNGATELSSEAQKEINDINAASDRVSKIAASYFKPQDVINPVSRAMPEGVSVRAETIDFETGKVILAGVATNRQSLLEFKQNLEKEENFDNIVIPLSSFEIEENLTFEVSLDYKPATQTKGRQPTKLKVTP